MNLHVLLGRVFGFTSRCEESSRACLESLGSTVNLNGGDSFNIYHCETQWQLEPIAISLYQGCACTQAHGGIGSVVSLVLRWTANFVSIT